MFMQPIPVRALFDKKRTACEFLLNKKSKVSFLNMLSLSFLRVIYAPFLGSPHL